MQNFQSLFVGDITSSRWPDILQGLDCPNIAWVGPALLFTYPVRIGAVPWQGPIIPTTLFQDSEESEKEQVHGYLCKKGTLNRWE